MIDVPKQINWFGIRLAIYVLGFAWAIIAPFMIPGDAKASLAELTEPIPGGAIAVWIPMYLVFLGIFCGLLLLVSHAQIRLSGESKRWAVPNHHGNFLNWNEQLLFWHFGGWLALSMGAGCSIAGLWSGGWWLMMGIHDARNGRGDSVEQPSQCPVQSAEIC